MTRYAIRTLVGPWTVLPAAGVQVLNYFSRGRPWLGEGLFTVEWGALSLFIICPIVCGLAAVDAARLTRPGNVHLVIVTPIPSLPFVWALGWCAGPVAALQLLAIVGELIAGHVTYTVAGWPALVAGGIVQCLAIVWFAAMGSLLGRFVQPVVAGMLCGGVSLALVYVLWPDETTHFNFLYLGETIVSRLGWTYHWSFLLPQAVLLLGTASAFSWCRIRVRSGRTMPRVDGLTVSLVAVAAIIAGTALLPTHRLTARPLPPSSCHGTKPRVCTYLEHRRLAPQVEAGLTVLYAAASSHGYATLVPALVQESSRTFRSQGADTQGFELADYLEGSRGIPVADLAVQLLTPVACLERQSAQNPLTAYFRDLYSVVLTWLEIAGQTFDINNFPTGVTRLTPDAVAAVQARFATCDLSGSA